MKNITVSIELPVDKLEALQKFLLEDQKPTKKGAPVPVPETPAVVEKPVQPAKAEEKEPEINKSMLRSKGVEITKAGKQDGLREIFKKFGANNLSSLSEEHYAEAYKLMEELI